MTEHDPDLVRNLRRRLRMTAHASRLGVALFRGSLRFYA